VRSIRLSDLGQLLDQPMNIATVIGRIEQRMVFISCHPTIAWHCQPLYVLNKMSCSLSVDVLYFCLPRPSSCRCATFLPAMRHGRVYWLLFFLFPVTNISATVAPIGVKFCMKVHIGPEQISPFGGGTPGSPNPKFWASKKRISRKR